jgi:hypothetical protein
VGLAIFLALGIGTYLTASSVIRLARDRADMAWAADLAAMAQVGIAAYATAGLFLNLATFDLYYHFVALAIIAHGLARQRLTAQRRQRPRRATRVLLTPAPDDAAGWSVSDAASDGLMRPDAPTGAATIDRFLGRARYLPAMGRIIASGNLKGGLAGRPPRSISRAPLAAQGYDVTLLDVDSRGHARLWAGAGRLPMPVKAISPVESRGTGRPHPTVPLWPCSRRATDPH